MRIAIALSGGIDSSAAAWLLQKQGWEVVGVTMRHFTDNELGFGEQEGIEAVVHQAAKVCKALHIPHEVINLQEDFSKTVMQDFISEYQAGRTPNPCTLCNRVIKWGKLLDAISDLGIEKMATGHYIKLEKSQDIYHLYRSSDMRKDQSYMLWQLHQKQLAKTVFPLAEMIKADSKQIIIDNQIPVSIHNESQEICFIKDHYEDFLKDKIPFEPGDIILSDGELIGRHNGLPLYTIGQRKGLHTELNVPLFVIGLHTATNQLIVSSDKDDLLRAEFEINKVNWIADIPEDAVELMVQIRYNSPAVEVAELKCLGEVLLVKLQEPVRAVTPGQSAVFYRNDELLGGGVIVR
ncbi:MAG: tRNA 2-thiouridine(34) synthase MnmA [Candidatus Stygibacter australis]|nr:tRNA 2-thiouridine(34) synthase MnmA [Candidatus Stygibacter australis]MDP8322990.1 tRNA 2-thiouridine(34) synthase MnmA [Candidatus Stygibacter australis]